MGLMKVFPKDPMKELMRARLMDAAKVPKKGSQKDQQIESMKVG